MTSQTGTEHEVAFVNQRQQISVQHVTKSFHSAGRESVLALDDINLEISKGSFTVLLGASGCGKSTLLRILQGLLPPSSGDISIDGVQLWNDGKPNREAVDELGVVFQDPNLFPWMNTEDNIALPLKLRGVGKRERRQRARELCELVGLTGFELNWPSQLSGGMRQRASIARALSYNPEILFMDEPFGALDALTRDQMNLELQAIWLQSGCTIVLVTHSISEAVFLADRVVSMSPRPGRITTTTDIPFERSRQLDIQGSTEFQKLTLDLRHRLDG